LICFYSVSQSILLPNMLISSVLRIKVSGLLLRIDVSLLEVVSKKDLYFVFSSNYFVWYLLLLCSLLSL